MENTALSKTTVSCGLSLAIVSIVNAVLVVVWTGNEITTSFKKPTTTTATIEPKNDPPLGPISPK